jgi:hypothetical protein
MGKSQVKNEKNATFPTDHSQSPALFTNPNSTIVGHNPIKAPKGRDRIACFKATMWGQRPRKKMHTIEMIFHPVRI